jgi:hypothetical protein
MKSPTFHVEPFMADHYEVVEGIDAYNPAATQPLQIGVALLYGIVVVAVVAVMAAAAIIAVVFYVARAIFRWIFEALGIITG